jgi:hypothetical protein
MGALISLARVANASQHYEKTFKAGKESIELESILHGEFKAEWRAVKHARKAGHRDAKAPERYHAHSYKGRYKPIKIKRAMTLAGSMGFRRAAVVAQRTIARGDHLRHLAIGTVPPGRLATLPRQPNRT